MLHTVTWRFLAVAACGWLLAWDAAGLTLGRARAAALIGRPLEVAIPATLDAPSEGAPCAAADLFYGDARIAPPAVRWEPRSGAEGVLRVTSPVLVDEPMVTLIVRIGCGQGQSRRYVLLSELPPENEPQRPAAPGVRPPVVEAPVAPPATRAAPVARAPARASAAAAAPVAPVARAERPEAAQSQRPRTTQSSQRSQGTGPSKRADARAPAPARPQPRLKLEPLDLGEERDPVLRITSELRTQVASDPAQREAAAALWQAVQKSPDEALQEALRLQGVERELESLRTATRENATALRQMRTQVERAQDGRQTAGLLVLGLALVLAALLSWIAWRWHRTRELERVSQWFEVHGEEAQVPPPEEPGTTRPAPVAAAAAPAAPAAPAAGAAALAAGAGGTGAARLGAASTAAPAAGGGPEFQASRGGTLRMVGVEELIDVHDKADFFLSIGETQQAIAVLEAHVHDQVETGALAWMDLLELYHQHGRRVEYERLRSEFQQRFTVQVPDFEHFDQPTATLENYSRALSRIVALWPAQRVLDVIEESIFRKPGLPGAEPFSLEAYRELVLLYHVAKDLSPESQEATDPGPTTITGFPQTSLQPLNALDRPEPTPADRDRERERLMIPPPSARLGVDIDLGELPRDEERAAPRDLPVLDFDISTFDGVEAGKPASDRG